MARPQQRYIEPDAIYTDMARGQRVQIPREFPYSWNPVNGYGDRTELALDSGGTVDGVFDDIVKAVVGAGSSAGKSVVGDAKKSAEQRAAEGVEQLLKGGPGQLLLDAVEKRATEGVTEVVKKNAPNLIMLAVAGGAVGGALSAKLGKTGTVLSLLVAGWAGYQLLNAKVPVK